jgi:hypothetical protein
MMLRSVLLAALLQGLAVASMAAGPENALKSCFAYAGLPNPAKPPETELFVMIDQTTSFSPALKQSIADHIKPLLMPGNAISVYTFSAYTQNHYTSQPLHAELDPAIATDARNSLGKAALVRFDQCQAYQARTVQGLTGNALREAFHGESAEISKSDVIASLQDVSRQVKASRASRKIVLMASDMLENSSVSSFYLHHGVRKIDPAAELNRASKAGLLGDFGGAEVYVLGAGLIAEDSNAKGVYRDAQTMRALQAFWQQYLDQSHAHLAQFGAPELLGAIRE